MIKNLYVSFFIFFLLGLFGLNTTNAQDMVTLPAGQTMLILSATEQMEVSQDLLVSSLRFDKEAKTSQEVQKTINEKMAKALTLIKKSLSLKVETGQYYVHPNYQYIPMKDGTNKEILDKWRGSQMIIIKSEASEEILKITAILQKMGFLMNNLEYQLSPKKYQDVRDGLMEKTITSLNERALRVGNTLHKPNVDLVEINISDNYHTPSPLYARASEVMMKTGQADDAMTAPSAEPGKTMVSLTINAKAIIKP